MTQNKATHLYPDNPLKIACAQAQPIAGDIEKNARLAAEMITQAASQGAALVQLPEKFLSGYEPDLIGSDPARFAVAADDPRLRPIQMACAKDNICAVIGAATYLDDVLRVSSIIVDGTGVVRGHYHKQFLFEIERAIYQAGQTSIVLDLDGWRFGLAICYDTGFGEHARAAALSGCYVYLASALFSKGNGAHERAVWFPARALDNTMFVALSNHVGTTGGWETCGQSTIWSPYGTPLAIGSPDAPEIVIAELDPVQLVDMRKQETMLADIGNRSALNMPIEMITLGGTGG